MLPAMALSMSVSLGFAITSSFLSRCYPNPSAAGSNKLVANPATGADSQRRERPCPSARTWPASSRAPRARCTVRWLDPSAEFLGYRPEDNAEAFAAELAGKTAPPGDPEAECHGGPFCALEFAGALSKID